MNKKIRSAQIGNGQLGQPWYKYTSNLSNWETKLLSDASSIKDNDFDIVFLAVPDSSLFNIISSLKLTNTTIVHFSGFHYFKEALGIHPVHSFSKNNDNIDFQSLKWVMDSAGDIPGFLLDVLGPSKFHIKPELKKIYHSYLSVGANMTQLLSFLMGEAFAKNTNLPPDLFKDLLLQSIENEKKFGSQSFSGPWVRDEKLTQDDFIKSTKEETLNTANSNFKNLIEVYHEHY